MSECQGNHVWSTSAPWNPEVGSALANRESDEAKLRWHFECPECRYASGQTSSRSNAMAMAEMHRHPVNVVSSIRYIDGHEHREITTPTGAKSREIKFPDQQRASEMGLRQLLGTHIFTPAFGSMGLDNMPLGDRTFGSIRLRKLGFPQASSMLENHYQMLMRQRGPQMNYVHDHVENLISGHTKPTVTVKYNNGTPILVHGLTDLAVVRKHLPDAPIRIQYSD
jgi:hypothetical protein